MTRATYLDYPKDYVFPETQNGEPTREERAQRRNQLLSGLTLVHKDMPSIKRYMGYWHWTEKLVAEMVAAKLIELGPEKKYRPYGWQSPRVRGGCFKTSMTMRKV